MRVDALGRAHVERAEGPEALPRQPGMHRARGEDHRHRHALGALALVGQDDVPGTRAHGILGLAADAVERGAERAVLAVRGEGAVDDHMLGVEVPDHLVELGVAHEGAVENEDLGLGAVLVQHVLEVSEPRLEAHHPVFAKRVDRRVRYLAEVLPEVVAERTILAGEDRGGRVVAHRGHHLLAVLGHRREDLLQLLDGVAGGDLPLAQFRPFVERLLGHRVRLGSEVGDLAHPLAEGTGGGQRVLDLGVVEELALGHVDGDELPGAERTLLHHRRLVDGNHARLGARDQHPLAGHDIAHGAQAVPVEPGADPAAVRHGERGGPVPGLHHRVAVGVHVLPRLREFRGGVGPCLGHQHRLGHRRGAARAHQHLEHGVERARVGCPLRDDRLDVLGKVTEIGGRHPDLVGLHPVDVALERVDLAVMREHPEGLRQPPLREGVGGIALVIDREGALEPFVLEVGIELGHLLRQHHALVDDRPAAERREIQLADPGGGGGLLDPAADDVKLAFEGLLVHTLGVRDDDLLDLGPGRVGLFAQNGDVHRNVAPAVDVVAHAQNLGFHDGPAGLLRAEIGAGQEHLTHGHQLILAGLVPGAHDLVVEEGGRDLHMDARAVAGLAIGIDRAPVPDGLECVDPVLHHLAAGLSVDGHDKAHPAGGMFLRLGIESVSRPSTSRLVASAAAQLASYLVMAGLPRRDDSPPPIRRGSSCDGCRSAAHRPDAGRCRFPRSAETPLPRGTGRA
jgi:hypothetical protein